MKNDHDTFLAAIIAEFDAMLTLASTRRQIKVRSFIAYLQGHTDSSRTEYKSGSCGAATLAREEVGASRAEPELAPLS